MSKLNRISKLTLVAVVGLVLLASVGAYAYWSVQKNINGNQVSSGSMTINDGASDFTPINVAGIMPGDGGLAKEWTLVIGSTPTSGDDLYVRLTNVADTVSLADNLNVSILLITGGSYTYWLNADGTTTAYQTGDPDPAVDYVNHLGTLSAFDGKSWGGLTGYTGMHTGDMRHIRVYYKLPLDCASDCHDDTASFDVSLELMQHH